MNYIFVKENAIPEKFCNEIIYKLNNSRLTKPHYPLQDFYKKLAINVYEQDWSKIFFNCVSEYKNQHPFIDKEDSRWQIDDFCNYQKYVPNHSYAIEHCEHGFLKENSRRMLAWMFYCNTIVDGGETCFPQQNLSVRPKKGTVLIWPAAWTHSHYGKVSLKEHKYIVTGWGSYVNNQES